MPSRTWRPHTHSRLQAPGTPGPSEARWSPAPTHGSGGARAAPGRLRGPRRGAYLLRHSLGARLRGVEGISLSPQCNGYRSLALSLLSLNAVLALLCGSLLCAGTQSTALYTWHGQSLGSLSGPAPPCLWITPSHATAAYTRRTAPNPPKRGRRRTASIDRDSINSASCFGEWQTKHVQRRTAGRARARRTAQASRVPIWDGGGSARLSSPPPVVEAVTSALARCFRTAGQGGRTHG